MATANDVKSVDVLSSMFSKEERSLIVAALGLKSASSVRAGKASSNDVVREAYFADAAMADSLCVKFR